MFSTTCRSCRGAGASNPNPCQTCTGEGVVKGQRTSDIKIPAGVDTDQILSLRGMGNVVGGRRGDLRLRISVTPSTIFRREGDDVHTTVDVPLLSALVGGTTRIATIHGDVEIRVLSGTQPGDVKRLISKGIHNETSGNIGSHYVTLKIVLPKSLTERQRDLLVALFGDETKTPGSQSEPSKQQGASSVGNKWSAWISEKIFGK